MITLRCAHAEHATAIPRGHAPLPHRGSAAARPLSCRKATFTQRGGVKVAFLQLDRCANRHERIAHAPVSIDSRGCLEFARRLPAPGGHGQAARGCRRAGADGVPPLPRRRPLAEPTSGRRDALHRASRPGRRPVLAAVLPRRTGSDGDRDWRPAAATAFAGGRGGCATERATVDEVHLLVPAGRQLRSVGYVHVERTSSLPDAVIRSGVPLAPLPRACIDAVRRLRREGDIAELHLGRRAEPRLHRQPAQPGTRGGLAPAAPRSPAGFSALRRRGVTVGAPS